MWKKILEALVMKHINKALTWVGKKVTKKVSEEVEKL